MKSRWPSFLFSLAILLPSLVLAGVSVGNIYGRVVDEQGQPLAQVEVLLTGPGFSQTARTTPEGEFRFLNLSPGDYEVQARHHGFTTLHHRGITLGSRQNADLPLVMSIASREETVDVTGEAPMLDTRRANVGANVGAFELERVASVRDPWVVIQSVPSVQMDRVNVGGSETGTQSYFSSKGMPPSQNAWTLDGVDINQTAGATGLGSTPSYFDFDSLQEIQISTGGTDPATQTAGAQVNLITKRGTNQFRGSARVMGTAESWVADNIPQELVDQLERGGTDPASNRVVDGYQFGGDAGGPIVRDRLWFYGAYDRSQTNLIVAGGQSDNTMLSNVTLKLTSQPSPNNTLTVFYNRADKQKFGRDASVTRPPETTWNQTGPNSTYKIEDSHVFGQRLFATVSAAYKDFGFYLDPVGQGQMRQDSGQVWHNTYFRNLFPRPQAQVNANASYFLRGWGAGHEIKAGARWLRSWADDETRFEGNVVACNPNASWCGTQSIPSVELNRHAIIPSTLVRYSFWLADTISLSKVTVNLGLRYDRQGGTNDAASVPASEASALVPAGTVLPPALELSESDPGFRWTNWQPRLGVTYALTEAKTSLLRATYARYAHQMGNATLTTFSASPGALGSTLSNAPTGVVYPWNDRNGDNHVDAGEIDTGRLLRSYGFNAANPLQGASSVNTVDPDFSAPLTDEFTVGFEHAISSSFAISVVGTSRRVHNFEMAVPTGITADDYVLSNNTFRQSGLAGNPLCPRAGYACGVLPDGTPYEVPVYRVNAADTPGLPPGLHYQNNPGYHQSFSGVEFQVVRRYTDRWSARLSGSVGDWTQHYDEDGYLDPTNIGVIDGGLAVVQSLGSGDKGRVYINGHWQFSLWALYTFPRGFEASANLLARQGYPLAYFQNVVANPNTPIGYERNRVLVVVPYEDHRLDDVVSLDLGVAKSLRVRNTEVRLLADIFNVLNANTVMQRQSQLGVAGTAPTDSIREVLPPRALRLGARVSF
jgi:hypothetical protein